MKPYIVKQIETRATGIKVTAALCPSTFAYLNFIEY